MNIKSFTILWLSTNLHDLTKKTRRIRSIKFSPKTGDVYTFTVKFDFYSVIKNTRICRRNKQLSQNYRCSHTTKTLYLVKWFFNTKIIVDTSILTANFLREINQWRPFTKTVKTHLSKFYDFIKISRLSHSIHKYLMTLYTWF